MINNISKLAAFFLPLLLETRIHLRIRHTDKAEIPMPQSRRPASSAYQPRFPMVAQSFRVP